MEQEVQIKEWRQKKVDNGKGEVVKKVLLEENLMVGDVMDKLVAELDQYKMHHFNAKWQSRQFNLMKKSVTKGTCLMVLDFAENYRCEHQNEVQSAHWSYTQCTVHPIVCYYTCNCCEHTVTHSIIAISDDLKHDCFAAEAFLERTYSLLKENGIVVNHCVQWTDGCGAQYKSKNPFYLLQESAQKNSFTIERNFFGSRHGKNPADGESAVLKSSATRSVKARAAFIQNASEMHTYANRCLTKPAKLPDGSCNQFRRSFILVKSKEIRRRILPVQTLKGTRKIHSMRSSGDKISYRNLSCCCDPCTSQDGQCQNDDYVDEWNEQNLITKKVS